MEIYEFAMKMEQEGASYYRENSEKVGDKNAARIFAFLAREERRHYDLFKSLKEGNPAGVADSSFIKDVKTVFQTMKEKGESFQKQDARIVDVLNHGLDMENRSIQYYVQKMNETDDSQLQEILLTIKREEDKHYSLLSSMIDYYLQPQIWNEQAEFTHLDSY